MPIYEFKSVFSLPPRVEAGAPAGPATIPTAGRQLSDVEGGRTDIVDGVIDGGRSVDPTDVQDFVMPGFYALDAAMKMFWSGMRVPTADSYRFCRVKVAGGDRTLMAWRDDMANGRTRLPVASLNRTKIEFNKDRFSPPYMPMVVRYPSRRGDLAALVYRPTPWLVDYAISVWAEHKRDAEYVQHQVLTRFNPLAVFRMSDGHVQGNVTLRLTGSNDQSEKETQADQQRVVKYEYTVTAEAWLPLPERLVPTVLGTVVSVKDSFGEILETISGNAVVV